MFRLVSVDEQRMDCNASEDGSGGYGCEMRMMQLILLRYCSVAKWMSTRMKLGLDCCFEAARGTVSMKDVVVAVNDGDDAMTACCLSSGCWCPTRLHLSRM